MNVVVLTAWPATLGGGIGSIAINIKQNFNRLKSANILHAGAVGLSAGIVSDWVVQNSMSVPYMIVSPIITCAASMYAHRKWEHYYKMDI